jgi:hypothetical protein
MNEIPLSIQGTKVIIMDATEKFQAFLAKLWIRKKGVEVDILANFQILQEVLYQDGIATQYSLSISSKREICQHLEKLRKSCQHLQKLQKSFNSHFYLDGIKVEPWIRSPFLSDKNRIEDVDLAKN